MSAISELAAQVTCAGFNGTSRENAPLKDLAALGLGAVILFARNSETAEQTAALTSAVHEALDTQLPALVGVDQEGGQVARVHDGVVQLPAMMALGATHDDRLAYRAGRRLGTDLRELGFNLDFAPVLDLALDPQNTVIGSRAFGADPGEVAMLGVSFARGLLDGGVLAVVKHFPGHGATSIDSHTALPILEVDEQLWRNRDLIPFVAAVREQLPAMMCAHVVLPALDAATPATLSPRIVTQTLRDELGFAGAIFSDCLEMAALGVPPPESAPLALAAGVDCVIISHHLDQTAAAIEAIEAAVVRGTLPRARLEDAAARMERLRAAIPPGQAFDSDREIDREIARRAVTVLRGNVLVSPNAPVTVVSFEDSERPSLSAALRRRGIKSEIMRVPLQPLGDDVELLEMILRVPAGKPVAIVNRRAHLYPSQAAATQRLLQNSPDAIVISAREPYDAALFENARNLACIYDDGTASIDGLADVMTGRPATV